MDVAGAGEGSSISSWGPGIDRVGTGGARPAVFQSGAAWLVNSKIRNSDMKILKKQVRISFQI